MKSNNLIQSLWIGNGLSIMEKLCINSYIRNGHTFHLYTYEKLADVPAHVIMKDANEIIPYNDIFRDHFGGFVNFSNLFRYTLLYKKGGWWVDMDTLCLRSFDFAGDFVFSSEKVNPLSRVAVNTTFIKSQAGAKFLLDCIDFIGQRGTDCIHWGELGVNLISQMIFRNDLQRYIELPHVFCPFSGYELNCLTGPFDKSLLVNSFAVHWWNELWRRKNLDKNGTYHALSLYETMKKVYLV